MCRQHRELGLTGERRGPGQHVERDAAQRIDVGATVEVVAADLLGGDVVGRAEDDAPGGQLGGLAVGGVGEGADSEVRQKGPLLVELALEQDVLRLDVAMDQPPAVGGVEGACDVREDPQRPLPSGRPVGEQPAEVDPVDELHRHEQAAGFLAGVVHRHEIRMLDRGGEP